MENINAIYNQVDNVIIVDNNSKNIAEIEQIVLNYLHICLIKSKCNEGIATALNKMMKKAKELHYTWCLTLDQRFYCTRKYYRRFFKICEYRCGNYFTIDRLP
ncbi:MAG: glycosyltransferase [Thomasclavelia sp.]